MCQKQDVVPTTLLSVCCGFKHHVSRFAGCKGKCRLAYVNGIASGEAELLCGTQTQTVCV